MWVWLDVKKPCWWHGLGVIFMLAVLYQDLNSLIITILTTQMGAPPPGANQHKIKASRQTTADIIRGKLAVS